jgi:hypothetical protein
LFAVGEVLRREVSFMTGERSEPGPKETLVRRYLGLNTYTSARVYEPITYDFFDYAIEGVFC